MAIIWNPNLSVANDVIDHDHKFMIHFINTIDLILLKKEKREYLIQVIDQLYEYAVDHFRREESIQRKIEYPKSIHHKHSHSDLLKDFEKIRKEFNETKSDDELFSKSDEIIIFLRNWLINHIIREDLQLKPYLAKHPKAFF